MTKETAFLRIDDRLVHGQVIVAWLPEIKPDSLVVVNDRIFTDIMRQELMALSVPPEIELLFFSIENFDCQKISEQSFLLVSSPKDAWSCLEKGIAPAKLNVGGMHSRENKEEIFEALHLDHEDRKYFEMILSSGVSPVFQPTPQNDPVPLEDIL